MSFRDMIDRGVADWMKGAGPSSDAVVSSRVRLARNIDGVRFPHVASETELASVVDQVDAALRSSKDLAGLELARLDRTAVLDRQLLVEKHLVSPLLAKTPKNRAVVLSADDSVSIMVNEEDHVRIQAIMPGLQLERAWEVATGVDDAFEAYLSYAFDADLGYVTACPTNIGTGLRASVMVHLPALTMTNQLGSVLAAVTQVGLAVRGLYGEGTQSTGNLYQVSNQVTLGRTEEEIVNNLKGVTNQIVDHERNARKFLMAESRPQIEDRVCRSYGILTNARLMSSEEAMKLLSDARLGIDMRIIPGVDAKVLNELMVLTQPGFLQKLMGRELTPAQRDEKRAALIREKLLTK